MDNIMFDIDHLLDIVKSILTPEEYQEYLVRLQNSKPIEMNGYYFVIDSNEHEV